MDSDDYVEPDYIQMLYQRMEGVDAVACGLRDVVNDVAVAVSRPENRIYMTNLQIREAYQKKKNLYTCYRKPHEKMYRSSVVGGLRFDESLEIGEDIIFNIYFLQKASNVRTIDYCGYNYYTNADGITGQRALRYYDLKECEYRHYRKVKEKALKRWGFSDEVWLEEEKSVKPSRYFVKVSNLVLPGTPYSKKQIREKIREIHADEEFVRPIRDYKYCELPLRCKIAKFSVQLNCPLLTEMMFFGITRTQIMLTGMPGLSKWINRIRKR